MPNVTWPTRLMQDRDRLIDGIVEASTELKYLRSAMTRTTSQPCSEADVLAKVDSIVAALAAALEQGSSTVNGARFAERAEMMRTQRRAGR